MKFFLDTAKIDEIRQAHAWGLIDGVTTNPTLIARAGGDFVETIHQICEIVQGPVSAETVSEDADGMLREGRLLARVSPHVVVKLPLTLPGLQACSALSAEGIRTNVTLCFTANQALLAAKAGATYVSPFLGRLDDISTDGLQLIRDIVAIYRNYPALKTQVLAASVRHPMHMHQVATLPMSVLKSLVSHPLTDKGVAAFLADWKTVPNNDICAQVEAFLARRAGA